MPKTGELSETDGTRPRKNTRRRVVLIAITLLICLAGGIVFLFSGGPVRVPMLGSLLALQGSRGPVDLSVGSASLDFTAPDGVEIILRDARADIAGPSPVSIRLPKLIAPLDTDAFLSGKVHFSALILENPHVSLDLNGRPAKVPEMGPLMEAIDRVSDVVDDQFARRGLRLVRVRDGVFALTGATQRNFANIDADIYRGSERTIRAYARVAGNVSTWRMELARSAPEGASRKNIGVVVNGITLAELLGPDADPKQGKGFGLPASAKIETRLDGDGKFVSANAVARVRNGWFQLGKTLVAFDDAALSLLFKADQPAIEITRSHVIRGNTRVFFTGKLEPRLDDTESWGIRLDAKHAQFGSADISEEPIMLDGILVRARFDPDRKFITIDNAVARAGKASLFAVGSVQITPDGPNLALAANATKVPIALAKQVWPVTLVPPARRWIIDNIKQGLIETARYSGALRPPAFNHRDPDPGWSGNDMRLDMSFSEGAVLPIGKVPEVSGLKGTVTVADETLTVTAEGGQATASTGGTVLVPSALFEIKNLPLRDGKKARVTALLDGEAEDLGAVMNSAPFHVLDRAGLEQGGASGSGLVDIHAAFPLGKKIDLADVDWRATGELEDFTDENPIMGHTIEKADVRFDADPAQVAITGRGVLDGLQADIDLLVPLGESGVAARQDVIVTVTAKQLKEKGIDLTAFLDGGMTLSVTKVLEGQEFVVDLKETDVRLEALGWQKSRGVPATAHFRLVETADERRIKNFRLTAEGADVTGSMRLSAAGDLQNASFDTFRLRPGDDVEVDIQQATDGRYDIIFAGTSFDGRGLIRSLQSPGGSKGAGDFAGGARISAEIDSITGFNSQTLRDFSGRIETGKKGLISADVRGLVNGSSNFEFALTDQGSSQQANGKFANTGDTLRFLDLYERMSGGTGALNVVMADEDSWIGDFRVRSLRITEDPAIRRIRERDRANRLNDNDPSRPAQRVDGSASFDALDLDFQREGNLLTISEGALKGNALGGTVSGTVDLEQQTLNLTGTFVPIYALNNFFAKIPLLGFALGGKSGEGLIGVTYRLSGAVSDPVLSVNPISAIAPGIFRKMFEFQQN